MAGAARGADDLESFGPGDLEEVGPLVGGGDVVLHLVDQMRGRPVELPQPAEGVLDEVADDPVRREELGGRRYLVCAGLLVLLETSEDLVLTFGDVELVEPADDLDVLADVLGEHLHRSARD